MGQELGVGITDSGQTSQVEGNIDCSPLVPNGYLLRGACFRVIIYS